MKAVTALAAAFAVGWCVGAVAAICYGSWRVLRDMEVLP